MAVHYVIDGYNLIKSEAWLSRGSLRDQRDRLLCFIEEKRPHGSTRNRITVVFDGRPGVSSPHRGGEVNILFSEEGDADQIIKNIVDRSSHPRSLVVVTNDKAVQRWVRGGSARIMSCGEFLKAGKKEQKKSHPQEKPELPSGEEITEEFRKLWDV